MANGLLSGNQNLCRLCLTDQNELYPIFGDNTADLVEKIYDCTRVEISKNNGMPALICQQCRAKIIVCHNFFENCQNGDQKYHRLFGTQSWKCERLSVDSDKSHDIKRAFTPNVPKKDVEKIAIPARNTLLDRLKNDEKLRRYSIDEERKFEIKHVVKKRLSDESQMANTSMELLAVKIEQSIKNEIDQKLEVDGRCKCPKCGLLVHNLRKHKQLHSAISKHVCGICNKTFTKRFLLKYHVNVHTGEKPYQCSECSQRFASPSTLYKHKLTHSGTASYIISEDQRFHCNVCNCVFKHRNLIHKHMRMKHRERKYPCEMCGKAYFTRDYLNKHMKTVHGSAIK